jgi:polyhydroxyalkanoate synthesis regulator phasin
MRMAVNEELQALIEQLKKGEIGKEEYERRSAELIDSIGSNEEDFESSVGSSVRRDRIRAAAKMARSL